MMKRKTKRFSEGGFSEAQEKWLGGADRTDPFILARMRKAVPDEPKAEPKEAPKEEIKPTVIESSEETGNTGIAAAPKPAAPKPAAPRPVVTETRTETKPKPVVKEEVKSEANKEDPKAVAEAYKKAAEMNTPFESNFPTQKEPKKGPSGKAKANRDAGRPSKSPNRSYKAGGAVKRSSASSRGDGIATKGHTRGRYL